MDIKTLCLVYEIRKNADGNERLYIEVDPHDMYPAIIGHIKAVMSGEVKIPEELLYAPARVHANPLDLLRGWLDRTKKVPDNVWNDALIFRQDLPELPAFVPLNWLIQLGAVSLKIMDGNVEDMLSQVGMSDTQTLVRMAQRAYALELALGWFQEATRVASPTNRSEVRILKDPRYKLLNLSVEERQLIELLSDPKRRKALRQEDRDRFIDELENRA
jgi:hypothetical protein